MRPAIIAFYKGLEQENKKSFYLAFLRVAVCVWLLKELYINRDYFEILYGTDSFVQRNDSNLFHLFPGMAGFIRHHYRGFIALFTIVILMAMAGIGRWVTILALYILVSCLHKLNVYNLTGGDKMIRLILLYLVFANSYDYLVLFKNKMPVYGDKKRLSNLLSNLAAYSIMLQLCSAYFIAGLAKINSDVWREGHAVYYALSMERFTGTPLNKKMVKIGWLMIALNYLTLFFEICFPFFVWIKQLRKPMLIMGIIFHSCIYIFMMIYGFQLVFIMIYGLFFTNQELINFVKKLLPVKVRGSITANKFV